MSILSQIKNGLNQLSIKPKKSLGQNFLINEGIYHKIITVADIKAGDRVIEIGPGLGTLTQYLLNAGTEIVAVEKDHKLADYLKTKFANQKNATILEDDILKFKPETCNLKPVTYKVAGNIPYYLTSHLLRIIFENWPQPKLVVLMIQKEVAQRIVAKPPKMSLLSVLVQYYSKPEIISYVSKSSFWPSPEVDSAIIKLVPSDQWLVVSGRKTEANHYSLITNHFFKIVRAGFAGKRKQLSNNLARGLKLDKKIIEEKLKSIGIEPTRRAETLTLNEWQNIAITLLPH